MSINDPLSPIRMQVMWNRLIAVVEEQAQTLVRTAFSRRRAKRATCPPACSTSTAACWRRR